MIKLASMGQVLVPGTSIVEAKPDSGTRNIVASAIALRE
jgi:hypothetical protein